MGEENINLIVYCEDASFSSFIVNCLNMMGNINLIGTADSIASMDRLASANNNVLVLLCASKLTTVHIISVFEIFEKTKCFCVAVCDNPALSFALMRRGALSTVIFTDKNVDSNSLFIGSLKSKIKDANKLKSIVKIRDIKQNVSVSSNKMVVVGASTGGTEALLSVLKELPAEMPPILVVQHMPAVFTKMYAERLNSICKLTVWEARNGDVLRPGLVLVAPGDMQMRVVKKGNDYVVDCRQEGKVNGVEPSVDVLFDSVCDNVDKKVIGVILTGMGSDGAKGLLKLRKKGAFTIGQDAESSIVYGMPKVAYEIGAVQVQAPLNKIAKLILDNI